MQDKTGASPREEAEGGRAERLLPELLKRLVEGIDKFSEGKDMRQRIGELKLPKEVLALLLSQLEESKNGLYRALAKELRDFLEQTNFAEELTSALTKLTFEIRTEVRFVPSTKHPSEGVKPDIKAKMTVKRGAEEAETSTSPAEGDTKSTQRTDNSSTRPPPTPAKED